MSILRILCKCLLSIVVHPMQLTPTLAFIHINIYTYTYTHTLTLTYILHIHIPYIHSTSPGRSFLNILSM